MANNSIDVLLGIDDKGSLRVVTKNAGTAAKALDGTTASTKRLNAETAHHNKQQKGVAGATANSTKAFSKMTTGMTGGIVPAYAVLAANIFALTAAFGALSRAAQFEKLQEGLTFTGNAAGVSLGIIVDKVTEITDSAVSAKQAMESVAIGVSAGFDATQIEGLAKVAKGASLALGRDLGDALDRLTRGAAKLEPEILDELGIMVRLDSATQRYATSIGKGVEQLTQFQRRQAFVNEILDQGARKFGDLSEAIETSAYDKLAATFFEVTQNIIKFINVPLEPFIRVLANSVGALTGVVLIFGSTLLKTIIGPLTGYTAASIKAAKASTALSNAALKEVAALHGVSAAVQTYQKALHKGTATQQQAISAARGARVAIGKNEAAIKSLNGARGQLTKNQSKSLAAIEANNAAIAKNNALLKTNKAVTASLSKAKTNPLRAVEIAALTGATGKVKELQAAEAAGTATTKLRNAAIVESAATTKALELELARLKTQQIQLVETENVSTAALKANTIAVTEKTAAVANSQKALKALQVSELTRLASVVATTEADALSLIAKGRLIKGFNLLGTVRKKAIALAIKESLANTGVAITAKEASKQVSRLALAGKGLLAALGPLVAMVGLFLIIGAPLYSFLKDKFFPEDLVQKRLNEATEAFKNFAAVSSQFENSSSKGADRIVKAYTAYSGVLSTIRTTLIAINSLESPEASQITKKIVASEDKIRELNKKLEEAKNSGVAPPEPIIRRGQEIKRESPTDRFERQINNERAALRGLREEAGVIHASFQDIKLTNLRTGLKEAIQQIQIAKGLEGPEGLFNIIGDKQISSLIGILDKLENSKSDFFKDGKLDIVKFMIELRALEKAPNTIRDSFKGADDAVSALGKSLIGLKKREKGILGDTLDNAMQVQMIFKDIAGLTGKNSLDKDLEKNKETLDLLKKSLTEKLADLPIVSKTAEGIDKLIDDINRGTEAIILLGKTSKEQAVELAVLRKAFTGLNAGTEVTLEASNDLTNTKLDLLREEEALLRNTVNFSEEEEKFSKRLIKIEQDRAKLNAMLFKDGLIQAKVGLERLAVEKEYNKVLTAREGVEVKILKLNRLQENIAKGRGARLTSGEEFELAVRAAEVKVQAAERSLALENARAKLLILEKDLELEMGGIVGTRANEVLAALKEQLAIQKEIAELKVAGANADLGTVIATANRPDEGIGSGTRDAGVGERVESAVKKGSKRIDEAMDTKDRMEEILATAESNFKLVESLGAHASESLVAEVSASLIEAQKAVANANAAIKQEFINTLAEGISPFLESLRELGEDGVFVAALAEGSLQIASAITVISNSAASAADKLDALSSIVGSIIAIHAAKSSAIVAGIDAEIAAEEKRDGKSAASTSKIIALEKKKEQQKKKAFETNKKMMLAQTAINTAAGMVSAIATSGNIYVGIALAAMIAALGAAQMGIIAGTSYQGGSSSAGSSVPSSVSVGDSSNTVDLASSTSASGELAYFRGADGTGDTGATNYVPGRAAGGNVAFPVGEQGPEMFVPDRPGTIVPADETQNTGGQPLSVSFMVNTIDSQGMEEALTKQRGNIIKMIREAANDHGEFFLESVSTYEDEAKL